MVTALVVVLVVAAGIGSWLLLRDDVAGQARSMTEEVATSTFTETVTASGTLRAAKSEDVSFDVSGTVTKLRVEAGDKVRKGQALATIDAENLEAALAAAKSEVTAARTALSEAFSDGSDSVQVAARRSALAAAQAEADEAAEDVESAVLRAPFAGTVTSVDLKVGDRVGSSAGAGSSADDMGGPAASTSTATSSSSGSIQVATTGRFEVDAEVSAADVEKVKEGLQVELTVTGVDETVYGTVAEVGRLATISSSGSAVFDVVVEVTGEREDLYAGASTDLTIVVSKRTGVLAVSTRAVQRDDEGTYVTVVVDGKEERREVEVGSVSGVSTEVTAGLEEGETVLRPGFSGGGREGSGVRGGGDMPEMPSDMSDFPVPPNGGMPGGFGGGMPGGGR